MGFGDWLSDGKEAPWELGRVAGVEIDGEEMV